nr:MAG TPA: hypothetical protein [Caudoviricetes sp.]
MTSVFTTSTLLSMQLLFTNPLGKVAANFKDATCFCNSVF